ncbi:hypothetical protein ASG89_04475 [Paenibacillus sp. Soil766]|uniref:Z-ring formation inhibitor MciZ n=1 Tax=Paenibacillus sp. Soil766 TaxID=1736404 RepID=UPI0007110DC0|nr:Z-ring formation inhibitor MciZ [Paenibacillus sp. Soil766]KRE98274.1 hypothetical protein ASG89_04475 [Paenibacillus sp. Soil766]
MKSYVSDKQIRLVGKAWEIKYLLQQMLQHGDPKIPLVDYLIGLYISQKATSHAASPNLRSIPSYK